MDEQYNSEDFRGGEKKSEKKIEKKKEEKKKFLNNFYHKEKTLKSLKDVDKFLCNFHQVVDYITLYKILK